MSRSEAIKAHEKRTGVDTIKRIARPKDGWWCEASDIGRSSERHARYDCHRLVWRA